MPYSPAGIYNPYGTSAVASNYTPNVWYNPNVNALYGYAQTPITSATVNSYVSYQQVYGTLNTATVYAVPITQTYTTGNVVYYGDWPQTPETEEEMVARLKRQAEWDEQQKKISARARELLEATLNDEQREQLKREHFFDLETSSGRLYRIKPGRKVERLDPATKKATSLFCIHPNESLPADDIAVSQKMWLETDEEAFIRTANETKLAA